MVPTRLGTREMDNNHPSISFDTPQEESSNVFDERNRPQPITTERPSPTNHFQNFIDTIRGEDELRAEIEVGHLSATLCHLGNLAARVGRGLL